MAEETPSQRIDVGKVNDDSAARALQLLQEFEVLFINLEARGFRSKKLGPIKESLKKVIEEIKIEVQQKTKEAYEISLKQNPVDKEIKTDEETVDRDLEKEKKQVEKDLGMDKEAFQVLREQYYQWHQAGGVLGKLSAMPNGTFMTEGLLYINQKIRPILNSMKDYLYKLSGGFSRLHLRADQKERSETTEIERVMKKLEELTQGKGELFERIKSLDGRIRKIEKEIENADLNKQRLGRATTEFRETAIEYERIFGQLPKENRKKDLKPEEVEKIKREIIAPLIQLHSKLTKTFPIEIETLQQLIEVEEIIKSELEVAKKAIKEIEKTK
jgi:hypothetical protein